MAEKFKYSDEQLSNLLDGIYSGSITEYDIPEDLYHAIADYLKSGVYKGFGGNLTEFSGKDFELLNELRENIYMFSAAKSYQQIKDISSLMLDENGDRVSNSEFNRLGAERFDTWNEAWGRTEYNTAVAQATMAGKWNEIQSNKDLLPILSYSTIGDACDICAPLDGLTAPVDDPVWDEVMPTNHFNCECTVSQHEDGKELTPDDEKEQIYESVTKEMDDSFRMNPGKDGYIFSPDHPYFYVEPKDRDFAKENFGMPIPTINEETGGKVKEFIEAKTIKEAEKFAREVLEVQYANFKGLDIQVANDMNRGVFNTKAIMPEFKINGIGTGQEVNKALKAEALDLYKQTDRYQELVRRYGIEQADKVAESSIRRVTQKIEKGTIAWSQPKSRFVIDGNVVTIEKYTGIYTNSVIGKKAELINETVLRCEKSGWFTAGAKDSSYIVAHEIGHELDKFMGIKNMDSFKEIFNREHKLGLQSLSEKLSKYGATAGKIISHRPDEMIAEAWAEFTTSNNPRPLAKEIGELIAKTYHTDFIKGSGVKYSEWVEQITKTIRK